MVSYTCKLRGNTSHSERLITLAGLASSTEVTFIPVLHEPGQPGAAIPNTHNKRHICSVQRRQNIRYCSVLFTRSE